VDKNLTFDNIKVNSEKLKKGSELFDIFVMVKNSEKLSLKDVINVNNKFLILDFEKCEIVFRYSKELLQFFAQFKNYTFDEIKKFLFSLKCDTIIKKFRMERVESYNEKFLFKHYSFFEEKPIKDKDSLFNYFKRGLSFNNEYLSYKTDILIDNQKKELLIVGTLFTDYLNFIEKIKEVADE
jgi:heat-inducible transcriptional repressor